MPFNHSRSRSVRTFVRFPSVSWLLLTLLLGSHSFLVRVWAEDAAPCPPCYDSIGVYQSPIDFVVHFNNQPAGIPDGAFYSRTGSAAFYAPTYPAGTTNFEIHYSDVGTHDQNIKYYNSSPARIRMIFKARFYYLIEFHFHSPSEHRFTGTNGRTFQMELHLVFRESPDPKDTRPGLVIGVPILVRGSSAFDASLARILNGGSLREGQIVPVPDTLFTSCLNYPNADNFPPSLIYPGSLTTPPFTEGYTWIVVNGFVAQTAVITPATLAVFKGLTIGGSPIGASRDPQAPWSRPLLYFDPPPRSNSAALPIEPKIEADSAAK